MVVDSWLCIGTRGYILSLQSRRTVTYDLIRLDKYGATTNRKPYGVLGFVNLKPAD